MRLDKLTEDGGHRTDLGDIRALADSIESIGLLHPVVVTPDLRLVAGRRRLAAMRALGWTEGPVRIVDNLTEAADILRAEADENTCRKDYTPTEAESLATAREALLKPLAKEAMSDGGKGGKVAKVGRPSSPPIRTPRVAAAGTGYSSESIRKVREVKRAAEAPETPEPVRAVAVAALAEMDSTGRVDGAYRRTKDAEAVQAAPRPDPAVTAYLDGDQGMKDIAYVRAFLRDLKSSLNVVSYDVERLADLCEPSEADLLAGHIKSLVKFGERFERRRNGFRLIAGGSK
jgi:ParB family chromosome partitioning protein